MVYKISNALTICHMWCQNLRKTPCCIAAHQRHCRLSGVSHPCSPSRAQRTHRFMRKRVHALSKPCVHTQAHWAHRTRRQHIRRIRNRSMPCAICKGVIKAFLAHLKKWLWRYRNKSECEALLD